MSRSSNPQVPIIGRDAEREAALQLLYSYGKRLVTIVGPGGIGKTSLALRIATDLGSGDDPSFADGAAVVLLVSLTAARDVPLAIVEALDIQPQSNQAPIDTLLAALRDRSLLLVLDNCEQLLGPGEGELLAALIQRILAEAPGVRLLVTSRERLRLRDEHVLELGGLTLPPPGTGPHIERSAAVQLFVERAQRADPAFALQAGNRLAVAHICRQLEGSPLAIELAAAWVRVLTPQEIADALDRSLDLLTSTNRDTPTRHRSMRAALDHSWQLLSEDEQLVLAGLAIFPDGCDRVAAEAILGASHTSMPLLTLLAALIDKSLLRHEVSAGSTRYTLHALVRQYAAEQLAADHEAYAATATRHSHYYAGLLQRAVSGRTGAVQTLERKRLTHEIDNLRAAWMWATSSGDLATLRSMVRGVWVLYEANGWILEGAALFDETAEALQSSPHAAGLRSYLLVLQATFLGRAGRLNEVQPLIDEGMALAREHPADVDLADLSFGLGMIELTRGRITPAAALLTRAAANAQASSDHFVEIWAQLFAGMIARFQGDYATAEALYRHCLAISRQDGFVRGEAAALTYLADLARIQSQYATAVGQLSESLRIAGSNNDRWALALALAIRGGLAIDQGEPDEGHYLLSESAAIVRELSGEHWLLGAILCYLGEAALMRGAPREAQRHYAEVLSLVQAGTGILEGDLVYGLAQLYAHSADDQTARQLLLALDQTNAEQHILRKGARLRERIESRLPDTERIAPEQIPPLLPWLEELCARPLSERALNAPIEESEPPREVLPIPQTGESLSAREIEVLRLLVGGASNQAIADTLIISRHTAKHHVASILAKLGLATRTEAALYGRDIGLEPLAPR